jgi:hypothetical protein
MDQGVVDVTESIDSLNLSKRVRNALRRSKINTFSDLVIMLESDEYKQGQVRDIGLHAHAEITEALKGIGLPTLADSLISPSSGKLSPDVWAQCLDYWDNRCAICGRKPDTRYVLAQDHWLPRRSSACTGTVVTNIVPLCHSRVKGDGMYTGCNDSKSKNDPYTWLALTIGQVNAEAKMREVFDYFDWWREKEKGDA